MNEVEIYDQGWQVPARTVDMLGRQQIANIPTALHELFKNAHDAYAMEVVADYFRADNMLVIRDDGDGMTEAQLRNGWLTLASTSKAGANDAHVVRTDGREQRAIMGEKGIGRLAIASIGPQVLVMTRPKLDHDAEPPLLVSLVHWGVNQLPDVDLSRIVIPTLRFRGGGLPGRASVDALVGRLVENVEGLRTKENTADIDRILGDLKSLDIDPLLELERPTGPSLKEYRNGTLFVVKPTNEMLASDLERPSNDQVSQVEKYLLGFSNTMVPEHGKAAIIASFVDHREDSSTDQPIGEGAFFLPTDFDSADHVIRGVFDPFGQFHGTIKVYGSKPQSHQIHWKGLGTKARCGPFRIDFAYIQGAAKDSRLDPRMWGEMSSRLNLMGGLYVYRDGIRILPYGGPDQDFVGIERRRTKSASDWFFSYRRMFGAVELTDAENRPLREKAGREGFIRDGAYNDFVSILSNFFETLAIDFFREGSLNRDWVESRNALQKNALLLEKRSRSAKGKLAVFDRGINRVFEKLESGELSKIVADIDGQIDAAISTAKALNADRASLALFNAEKAILETIDDLDDSLKVSKPRGAALNRQRTRDWEAYVANIGKIRAETIAPLKSEVRQRIDAAAAKYNLPLSRRLRVASALDGRSGRARANMTKLSGSVEKGLDELRATVERTLRASVVDLSNKVTQTQIDFESTDLSALDEGGLDALQNRWERVIEDSAEEVSNQLEALSDQLRNLSVAVGSGETLDQTTDAIETRAENYQEQLDQYVELAQLGAAVGIMQHEFSSAVRGVRSAIRKLEPWARANPSLGTINRNLRDGFEHLDAYLNLFAPLSRRLRATRVEVSGSEIQGYLDEVFRGRLERHEIEMKVSEPFKMAKLPGQPSAIFAAFVNVVDNAIHWAITRDGKRFISLGTSGDGLTVSNSGPGVEARIAERIFEYGETTRLGGRGLGLYVSREALRRSDLDLTLLESGRGKSPTFCIGPRAGDTSGDPT